MRTLVIILACTFWCATTNAQIVLEHTYSSDYTVSAVRGVSIVHLANSGKKFVNHYPANQVSLYNLNHTLFKNIAIPSQDSVQASGIYIGLISETLFNNDSKIEYLLSAYNTIAKKWYTKVYNEDSMLLFYEDGYGYPLAMTTMPGTPSVYNTDSGTRLILRNPGAYSTRVYQLAGTYLPTQIPALMTEAGDGTDLLAYPNPAAREMKIAYTLPENAGRGKINIYDLQGRLLSKYDITSAFKELSIDTPSHPGTYLYQLVVEGKIVGTGKFVVE